MRLRLPLAKVNKEMMELARELVGMEGLEPSFLGHWIQVRCYLDMTPYSVHQRKRKVLEKHPVIQIHGNT
jgi:hypothetical protein